MRMQARSGRPSVGMALYGDVTYDSRVRKEARTLAASGYDVSIFCLARRRPGLRSAGQRQGDRVCGTRGGGPARACVKGRA